MRNKVSQTKLSEKTQEELKKLYETTYNALQNVAEGFLQLRLYTISEIKKIGFTAEELTSIIASLNGSLSDSQTSCNAKALRYELEDFETLENGISRYNANPEQLLSKIDQLTAAQTYFLQEEIYRWWGQQTVEMNEFIESLQMNK